MTRTAIIIATLAAALLPFGPASAQSHDHAAHDHAAHAAATPTPGLWAGSAPASASAAALPANSLYQLATPLTDAAGQRFSFKDLAGQPVLVTMFYGDCHSACPIVIETLKRTVGTLGQDGKRLRILLVSLDPKHDTPNSLSMMAQMQNLDPAQYRLAVARDDSDTRMVASALNIRYRMLDNGEISHTTRLVLLNADGGVAADSTRLATEPDPVLVKQIRLALKK